MFVIINICLFSICSIYQNLFSLSYHFNFFGYVTKRKFLCCVIVDYFAALIKMVVSRDLMLLRCLFLCHLTHSLIEDE